MTDETRAYNALLSFDNNSSLSIGAVLTWDLHNSDNRYFKRISERMAVAGGIYDYGIIISYFPMWNLGA